MWSICLQVNGTTLLDVVFMTGARWHSAALDLKPGEWYLFFETTFLDTEVRTLFVNPVVKYSAMIKKVQLTQGKCQGMMIKVKLQIHLLPSVAYKILCSFVAQLILANNIVVCYFFCLFR